MTLTPRRVLPFIVVFCAPLLFGATTTVSSGGDLQAAIQAANPGDTILVGPGTYTAHTTAQNPYNAIFDITKSVTIRSTGGAAVTTLAVVSDSQGNQFTAARINASNFVLDGFTLAGGGWGVQVVNWQAPANPLTNVVLRNLVIYTNEATVNAGHGISLQNTSNSVVENCDVKNAYANGILIDTGSNSNLVIGNTVEHTTTQHGIGVKDNSFNVISGNTVTGAAFDAILLIGASYTRVEGNNLSGFLNDGIVTTRDTGSGMVSTGNYLGKNLVVSNGYQAGRTTGAGIWIDSQSAGTEVFGNDASGSVENGIDVFNSNSNFLRGNSVHQNGQGGIFVTTDPGSTGASTAYNVIQHNYSYDHCFNGGIQARQSSSNRIAFNFIASGPHTDVAAAGLILGSPTASQAVASTVVSGNTIQNLPTSEYVYANVTSSSLFLNRHFNSPVQYSVSPAQVNWDAGSILGGNFWSSFPVIGNPSSTPYTTFLMGGGNYADHFPFQSENFGKPYVLQVVQPAAGVVAAAGSRKTIAWQSQGCVFVDISFGESGLTSTAIVTNYPDTGFYIWTVPAATPAGDYAVQVTCKTSVGAGTGVTASSGQFAIANSNLVLLSPGPDLMANSGGAVLVSWRKAPSSGGVNVYLQTASNSGYVLVASNVTDDFVTVTLPVASSNRASVKVQDPGNLNSSDSVDGFFSIRGSSGLFVAPTATTTLVMGSEFDLSWVSPQGSVLVDLDLWNPTAGAFQNIVTGLADFGAYSWLVPAAPNANAYIRATFKNAAGGLINTAQSGNFNLGVNSVPSVAIDAPVAGATVSGTVTVSGWAIDNTTSAGTAIGTVQVKVDGVAVGTATYGVSRPDVCAVWPGRAGCPNVGFTYALNTASLTPGSHTITVSATNTEAPSSTGSMSVNITVSGPLPYVAIDVPAANATVSGTVMVSGWALDNITSVGTAISKVQVRVDGGLVGTATYGSSRTDVCGFLPGRPGCPNVGYTYALNTATLTPGSHTITVSATDSDSSPDTGSASVVVVK